MNRSEIRNSMNRSEIRNSIFFFAGIILILAACTSREEEAHRENTRADQKDSLAVKLPDYYCPMDTEVVQNKPGICPKCNMDLELKPQHVSGDTLQNYTLSPAGTEVLSSAGTIKPVRKSLPLIIKASGRVEYDTRRIYTVSARIDGRIERLYVKYRYQPVKKGQALLEIYSHELLGAQNEYLYIKRSGPEDEELLAAARKKLLLLGMTDAQVRALGNDHNHTHPSTTFYSPWSGFVLEKAAAGKTVARSESSMNGASMESGAEASGGREANELLLREGAYVRKGETIFRIANTDVVWGVFEVYSSQLPYLKTGSQVHILAETPEEAVTGKISFIEPSYKDDARTLRFRVDLDNRKQWLKVNDFLSAEVDAGEHSGLWIPQSALIDIGSEKIVFVKAYGSFVARKVLAGLSSGDQLEVLKGLTEQDSIAVNAQFLIDSESFVKADHK